MHSLPGMPIPSNRLALATPQQTVLCAHWLPLFSAHFCFDDTLANFVAGQTDKQQPLAAAGSTPYSSPRASKLELLSGSLPNWGRIGGSIDRAILGFSSTALGHAFPGG